MAFNDRIVPAIDAFAPDLIIISAGFDAHWRDPLAQINLNEEDFVHATLTLMEAAQRHCGGRIVSLLEGGYDLAGLAGSAAMHVADADESLRNEETGWPTTTPRPSTA